MAQIDPKDLVWIEDAAREFDRSRRWLTEMVAEGKLTPYTIEGNRRMYLSREELKRLFTPRVRKAEEEAG